MEPLGVHPAGRRTLGLIVNPVAGLGGRVGLKGSDGASVQREALARGAAPLAEQRARQALAPLAGRQEAIDVLTVAGEMGEAVACASGFAPRVVGSIPSGRTTAEDTKTAAREMERLGVDLLLFAGGDGTARDVYDAVGERLVALGIPAGVKMHSAVFAVNPVAAGDAALSYLVGRRRVRTAEVMDVDEQELHRGIVSTRLYGYLRVPEDVRLVQSLKAPTPASEGGVLAAIAADVVDRMVDETLYILGPGTTTRAIATRLGLAKTLLGIDVVSRHGVVIADATESQLLAVVPHRPAKVIVSPIGGQGHLFGRGNQPISPAVLRAVGRASVLVVAAPDKIRSLGGRPFLVDTGDADLDHELSGYVRVVTGYGEEAVYEVSSGGAGEPAAGAAPGAVWTSG